VAKTEAKMPKIKLKIQNIYIQLLLNVKIFEVPICVKNVKSAHVNVAKYPIWSHWVDVTGSGKHPSLIQNGNTYI
jgi:hypothetical protein